MIPSLRVRLEQIFSMADPGVWGPENQGGGVSVLRSTNFNNDGTLDLTKLAFRDIPEKERARKRLVRGDIILERSGGGPKQPVGRVCWFPGDDRLHVFGNFCQRFRAKLDICDSRYLFWYLYWFHATGNTLRFQKQTTGIRNLEYKYFLAHEFDLPSKSEQQHIVEILDSADILRKKCVAVDAKATRILPATFYNMFGDPATNPKGWNIKPLSDLEAQVRYGLGQPPKTTETGIGLIRATNISRGTISATNMIYVDPHDVPPGRNAFLEEDEVIVVRSGAYTGDVAQVTKEWRGCVAGYDLVITPGKYLTGEFVESYLLTAFIQKGYFQNLKARAGQPHLNAAQVAATPFLCVPHKLQIHFSEAVQSMRALRKRISAANENLERAFTIMLHHAFTGDLTAKWREAHMEELLLEIEAQAKALELSTKLYQNNRNLRHN